MSETRVIDLRSDTVTLPTPAMREAMGNADVGDDVHGEDPTVKRLERMAADLMGKEAAVFVASGTMGNLVSLLSHCGRGDEAIVGGEAHVLHYEAGGVPALGSVELRTVPNDDHGMLDLAALEEAIRPDNEHFPRTAAICLENTHNRCGGGEAGVLASGFGRQRMRFVTHYGISRADIEEALNRIKRAVDEAA